MPKLRNGNNGDSNPGSLDCESGILPTELPRSTQRIVVTDYSVVVGLVVDTLLQSYYVLDNWHVPCYMFSESVIKYYYYIILL